MTAISKDLADALNSSRIAYLGSLFLAFFLLMMVLRFCGIKRRKLLTVALVAVGIVMLAITTSPAAIRYCFCVRCFAISQSGSLSRFCPVDLSGFLCPTFITAVVIALAFAVPGVLMLVKAGKKRT